MTNERTIYRCNDFPGSCCPTCHKPENEQLDLQVITLKDGRTVFLCCYKEQNLAKQKLVTGRPGNAGCTSKKGNKSVNLKTADIRRIRQAFDSGHPLEPLAKLYRLSIDNVERIARRQSYAGIPDVPHDPKDRRQRKPGIHRVR